MGKQSEKTTANFKRLLRSMGKRITPQRMTLLRIIEEQGGHLDADEIHRLAREETPHLSLSTVYRALNLFKELGLVEELHLAEGHHHYESIGSGEHHHLICLGCGKVIEFECPFTDEMRQELAKQHDFEITRGRVDLMGYCAECRKGR
ncbi:MAG: Fur family transcriptional regulator [Dehalococcoidia bacterium]